MKPTSPDLVAADLLPVPGDSNLRPVTRIAYLVSHPIQYQAPLLRLIAGEADIALTVFFQSDVSVRAHHDAGFGRSIEWDVPLLEGYRHAFLPAIGGRGAVTRWRPFSYGLAKQLRRGDFDLLWVHGYARWFNWVAMLAARMASVPVLMRDEATPISAARPPVKVQAKRLFFMLLDSVCDGFLAIGSLNRDYYLQNGIAAERIFSMPYCVDNAYFAQLARKAASRREQFRAALGLIPGRPVILFASKFERRKRAGDLLRAFATLLRSGGLAAPPYLLFVGDGETRQGLESEARPGDGVRFLGFRNQSELPAFFDLCDVFVLPSEFEPWGLVVNEAMNAGRAIIVSDQVGCGPDLVRNGENGYVYPVGDTEALARALAQVLRSPTTIAAMGEASLQVIADWNFQRDLAGLRLAVATVLARRRPRGSAERDLTRGPGS